MTTTPTYAETRGEQPFDWNAFLLAALTTPPTDQQWEEAGKRAEQWTTCACGNQCAILERDMDGCPTDDMLAHIGGRSGFYGAIERKDAPLALHYLCLIELHASYLIEIELGKQAVSAGAARQSAATVREKLS